FHRDETSLGLVRLRAARAIEDLQRLLGDAEKAPGMPPIGGRGGPRGPPAAVRVVRGTRGPPPEPHPKPTGRDQKNPTLRLSSAAPRRSRPPRSWAVSQPRPMRKRSGCSKKWPGTTAVS